MKTQQNPVLQVVKSRVEQLLKKYHESSSISHSGTQGSLREGYLKQFLSELIPRSLCIASGFVTDSRGNAITPQIDLLVYDPHLLPPAMLDERVAVLPIEVVLQSIEVKSKLSKDALVQVQDQQKVLRRLYFSWTTPDRKYLVTNDCAGIPQFLVAYDTKLAASTIEKWFEKEKHIVGVCVIGKWFLFRDSIHVPVSKIEADDRHSEVMHLVAMMTSKLTAARRETSMVEQEVKPGVTEKFYPDIGAYLTFDVPGDGMLGKDE